MNILTIDQQALAAAVAELHGELDPDSIWPAIVDEAHAWLKEQASIRMCDDNYIFPSKTHPSILYKCDGFKCNCRGFGSHKRCKHLFRARLLNRAIETTTTVIITPTVREVPLLDVTQEEAQRMMDELYA